MARPTYALVVCALMAACGQKSTPPPVSTLAPDEIPLVLEQQCPGDPSCPDQGDGKLYVGNSKREITPLVEPFTDLNHNGFYNQGEPFTDLNGNGRFDPVWIAGYGSGRLAWGIHDPTWVRCIALRQNQTTLVECVLDVVGFFRNEVQQIRADLDPSLGVDFLMVGSTHVHETEDSIGIWGPDDTLTGYDPQYMQRIRVATVAAATEAVGRLKPARMSIGSILVQDSDGDYQHYVSDTRDPVIVDRRLHLLQFDGADDGKPIVTVVNWQAHPESAGSDNHYISSDFVHYLRRSVEAGTGCDVVYITGSLGGQIGPGRVLPIGPDGNPLPRHSYSFEFAESWGLGVSKFALQAFDQRQPVDSPKLAFRTTTFFVHVENIAYHTAANLGLFHRDFYGYDKHQPLLGDNTPIIDTQVAYVTLGPAAIITVPGELLPENFVGGYDGSDSGHFMLFDPTKPNPPDISKAPKPPYLIDLLDGNPPDRMVWGLTNDFLGYIVPRYNFILNPDLPYLKDAAGDHYEETNSIGPRAEPEIVGTMRQLVTYKKVAPAH